MECGTCYGNDKNLILNRPTGKVVFRPGGYECEGCRARQTGHDIIIRRVDYSALIFRTIVPVLCIIALLVTLGVRYG